MQQRHQPVFDRIVSILSVWHALMHTFYQTYSGRIDPVLFKLYFNMWGGKWKCHAEHTWVVFMWSTDNFIKQHAES